jgi:hypothetical protein
MATKAPISKKELSANNTILAVVAICLLVVIVTGLALSFIVPRIVQNSRVIVKKVQAKDQADKKLDNSKALVLQYQQLGTKSQMVLDAIPTKADFAQTLVIFESIVNANGMRLKDAKSPDDSIASVTGTAAGPTAASNSYGSKVFQYTLVGPYVKLLPAIREVEKSARPMKVVATDIQGSGGQVTATLKVETYFQGEANVSDGTEQVK